MLPRLLAVEHDPFHIFFKSGQGPNSCISICCSGASSNPHSSTATTSSTRHWLAIGCLRFHIKASSECCQVGIICWWHCNRKFEPLYNSLHESDKTCENGTSKPYYSPIETDLVHLAYLQITNTCFIIKPARYSNFICHSCANCNKSELTCNINC